MQRGTDDECGKRLAGRWLEGVAQGGTVLGKERGEADVDALNLYASGECLGCGVAGAAVEEDDGRVADRRGIVPCIQVPPTGFPLARE